MPLIFIRFLFMTAAWATPMTSYKSLSPNRNFILTVDYSTAPGNVYEHIEVYSESSKKSWEATLQGCCRRWSVANNGAAVGFVAWAFPMSGDGPADTWKQTQDFVLFSSSGRKVQLKSDSVSKYGFAEWSPNGKAVLLMTRDLVDCFLSSGRRIYRRQFRPRSMHELSIADDCRTIRNNFDKRAVEFWDESKSSSSIATLPGVVRSQGFSPDQNRVVVSEWGTNIVRVFDWGMPKPTFECPVPNMDLNETVFINNNTIVALGVVRDDLKILEYDPPVALYHARRCSSGKWQPSETVFKGNGSKHRRTWRDVSGKIFADGPAGPVEI
jgi:hypothetical protein